MWDQKIEVLECEYHRNGIGGEGFYAIRFRWLNREDSPPCVMLAVLFDEPGQCAVIDPTMAAGDEGTVRFGTNSWRGDTFEDQLREHVKGDEDTGRMGPFSMFPELRPQQ